MAWLGWSRLVSIKRLAITNTECVPYKYYFSYSISYRSRKGEDEISNALHTAVSNSRFSTFLRSDEHVALRASLVVEGDSLLPLR
jgi:hypothetical protein